VSSHLTFGKLVPLNLISQATGYLSRLHPPQPFNRWLCQSFVRLFGIDMSEAAQSLDQYGTIEDIFTRALKPDARKIKGRVCSPADGILSCSLPAENGQALQAKKLSYQLSDLVYGTKHHDDLAHYATVYLAPHNYHRVHSPVTARLVRLRYFPGQLWPVNEPFVRFLPRLFNRNERLVFDFDDPKSKGRIHVVMVGALNVGRIESPFWQGFATNGPRQSRRVQEKALSEPIEIKAGQEIGTFMLGSTVVVVFDQKAAAYYRLLRTDQKRPVRMGDSLIARSRKTQA
jgi:phosphatidylserine decarboxylase